MSKAIIGDHLWAEMTEAQKVDAVLKRHATLKQMSEGLLDGSQELRRACQESLAHLAPSLENLPGGYDSQVAQDTSTTTTVPPQTEIRKRPRARKAKATHGTGTKQRFGLPKGFVPRFQRFGRGVLLELNLYRLPNGHEYIPAHPVGTLGTRQHLYALLTVEQYLSNKRGSVYVRSDGRIFDYSVDANPIGDFFDTGYTIYDLERTGQYAPAPRKKRKKSQPPKLRRAAAAG